MKFRFFCILSLTGLFSIAQSKENQEVIKSQEASKKFTFEGNQSLKEDKPIQAEVDYRKAIAKNKENATAQYNLGTMYYQQKSYGEAFIRLKNASTSNEATQDEKHQIFHNLGNVFMKEKAYDKAVQTYKEALRNNPNDEQTRYNLAVAQELLKKNPPPKDNQKDDQKDDKKQQNQDKDNQQNQNKDQKDNQNQQNQDKKEEQNNDKQNQNDKNQEEKSKEQNRPSSLSPQQIERILEAMSNEERKTQEKVQGQKVKAQRSKSEKDW